MPSWYKDVIKAWDDYDKKKKDDDSEFYDERLENYKKQEWDRRLNGFWYYNNGIPLYLTGMHYLYLQFWSIDIVRNVLMAQSNSLCVSSHADISAHLINNPTFLYPRTVDAI